MLDWLSSHQAASATEDQQIPDAPETPAPMFAYRALKGILFGSPDYDAEDEEDNKENIAPAVPDLKTKSMSPGPKSARRVVKVDSSSPLHPKFPQQAPQHGRFNEEQEPISPSPRRRRLPVSPTKSILRTPGLLTPRRQNVNVTFKDVRASASPIAVTTKLAARNEAQMAVVHGRDTTIRKTSNQQPGEAPREDAKAAPCEVDMEVIRSAYDMSAVDAYLKSTEREMRKLVKYSQRMKEYARVSQQENAALRRERDDLRREVEELRKARVKNGGVLEEHVVKDDLGFRIAGTQRGADNMGEKGLRGAASQPEQPEKVRAVQRACLPDRTASAGHAKRHESTAQTENEQFGQREAVDTTAQDGRQRVGSKKRAAISAQLAPDRLAAAKERVRVKSEERRRALSAAMG